MSDQKDDKSPFASKADERRWRKSRKQFDFLYQEPSGDFSQTDLATVETVKGKDGYKAVEKAGTPPPVDDKPPQKSDWRG